MKLDNSIPINYRCKFSLATIHRILEFYFSWTQQPEQNIYEGTFSCLLQMIVTIRFRQFGSIKKSGVD